MAVGASIATLGDILKKYYLPPVVEQLNNSVLFMNRIDVSNAELVGEEAVVPLHTTRSGGVGSRGEDVDLPEAGSQGFKKARYDIKPHYARVRVTGFSMEKTAKTAGAFLQSLKLEMDFIRNDIKRDAARQFYGDGTGRIATCGTTTASTTVVLSSAEALRKGHLHIGMRVDIGTLADPDTIAANREITDVNIAGPSITISGAAVTTSSSHFVFRQGNAVDGSVSYEIDGLDKIVSVTANTVGGIDASAAGNSFWDNLRDTTTSTLSSDALVQNINRVQIASDEGDITVMLGSYGLQRKLFGLLQSQVRYVEPMKIQGGFRTLEFDGRPFVADRDAPFGRIYLLNERRFKVFSNRDWHFLDEDGHVLKWVPNRDAWQAVLARYYNIGTDKRNTQLVMSNLSGDDPNGF